MSVLYKNTKIPIMVKKIDLDKDVVDLCIQKIYEIGDEMNNTTNVKAQMSHPFIHMHEKILREPLSKVMDIIENEYPTDMFINEEHFKKEEYFYFLKACWSAIYRGDDYTIRHHHLPAEISFCLYLQTDEFSSSIHFDDLNYDVIPEDNLLVVFPGYINHSVKKQKNNGKDRIMLAGNIILLLKE